MKTARGSHISAIIMAALNLLYMAGVTVFWLFNGVVNLNFLSLFIPINGVFLLTSVLLLISVCRKKFFTLICSISGAAVGHGISVPYWISA